MDFHLERGLRLHADPEYKNLYEWAINEIDGNGQKVGGDQIPWAWTLNFTATSCTLGDGIEIKSPFQAQETSSTPPEVTQHQVIRAQLRPGRARDDGEYFRETTFSMFGTDRHIKTFQLDIRPIVDPAEREQCRIWGSVAYTFEIDFRNETSDDCIVFSLFVKPETFARYAAKIAFGSADEMVLSVKSVDGFYSDWSPSISTDNVKVLTGGSEQKITLPTDLKFKPPRLGRVGNAQLYINRRLEFGKRAPEPDKRAPQPEAVKVTGEVGGTKQTVRAAEAPAAADPRILQTLGSLKRAAWLVVPLLGLIFIVILLKN
jgi:hypothetical protein